MAWPPIEIGRRPPITRQPGLKVASVLQGKVCFNPAAGWAQTADGYAKSVPETLQVRLDTLKNLQTSLQRFWSLISTTLCSALRGLECH